MKKLRELMNAAKSLTDQEEKELQEVLWQVICYSPKMPVRLHQQQLLDEATKFELSVPDPHFSKKNLLFNGFKWGTGNKRVLLTHGWGSKAMDFSDIICRLKHNEKLQIIAFDAPGNGSSGGDLSNLLLYVLAVKAVISTYGDPDMVIGHSLGAMANVIALNELMLTPSLLISLSPLIKLKENFEASMSAVGASGKAQEKFLESFESLFKIPASHLNLNNLYAFTGNLHHLIAYDPEDAIHPYTLLKEFLGNHPSVTAKVYEGAGHDKILKDPRVIDDILNEIDLL